MNEHGGDKNYPDTENSAIFSVIIGGSILTNSASQCILDIRYREVPDEAICLAIIAAISPNGVCYAHDKRFHFNRVVSRNSYYCATAFDTFPFTNEGEVTGQKDYVQL